MQMATVKDNTLFKVSAKPHIHLPLIIQRTEHGILAT